jgi:hypothetical protein
VPLFDAQSLWTMLIRFVFNFLVCWVIIHCFYYKKPTARTIISPSSCSRWSFSSSFR